MLLGDVDVYLREVLDKKWCDGGKILTFLCFLCSIRLTLVKPSGKTLLWRTKRIFCIMNTMYFAQRTGLFTENKVFETGLAIRGQVLSKLRNERSLDHLGRQMGGGAHTGALSCAAPPFKRSSGGGQKSLTQLVERRRWQAAWEGTDPPGEHRPGCRITGSHTR